MNHKFVTFAVTFAGTLASAILSLSACGDDAGGGNPQAECDASLRPIVFMHGFLAAGDTWAEQTQRFEANGYCADHLVAFDWNSIVPDGAEAQLDARIDALLAATGATQVDLVGHSAGGGLGYRYLAEPAHAAKVAHYAHLASAQQPGPAGPADAPVPTLAVRSSGDTIVTNASDITGATNLVLAGADHYEVATSLDTFVALWRHFVGGDPTTTDVALDTTPELAGKALALGENAPAAGWTVEVWAVAGATGERLGADAKATFTVAEDGSWGPFAATAGTRYELFLAPPAGSDGRPIHYYIEPVDRTDDLVYLRSLPAADSLVGALLAGLPFDDGHVDLIVYSAARAVITGRDTLTVGERTLSTDELASAERTTIAFFLFDENVDHASGGPAGLFSAVINVFLTAVDEYLAADGSSLTITLNERALTIPRWPSATAGATVVIVR